MNNFEREMYKKQKRQDWDHKAYHDAPSAIYCVQLPNEEDDMHII